MEDVADRAGVSRALVSLVMRDAPNVSDVRREAVLAAATSLGYRPNALARNLASRRTNTLGVVINDLHNPFFAETVDGLQSEAVDSGYRIMIGNGCRSVSGESRAVETLLDYRVDTIIVIGPRLPAARVVAISQSVPVVTIGRALRSRAVDTVNNDEALGARLAVKHLIGLGHHDISHIDGGAGAGAAPRRAGYEKAMREAGLSDRIRVVKGDFTESSGGRGARELLASSRPPTAVFAANDQSAIGALDAIESSGLSIPLDVSLVGYDNISAAATRHLSLTTIDQPLAEMGRVACRLAIARIEGSETEGIHHVVEPSLVVRATTSAPRSRTRI